MQKHSQAITTVAVSKDGRYLLSGSLDRKANLFDLNTMEIIQTFNFHSDNITSVAISPNNK